MTATRISQAAVILLIIILACGLRLAGIDKSFQGDEYFSVLDARHFHSIPQAILEDTHPPLYFYMLNIWMRVSMNEAYLRLLSVIPGVGLCVLVYMIGMLVVSREGSLFLAVITAFSPGAVWVSQYVRTYSWAYFFIIFSVYFLVRIIKNEQGSIRSRGLWIGYVFFSAAALYTFYFSALVLVAENIFMAVHFRKKLSCLATWALAQLSIAVSYLPWIHFFIRQRSSYLGHPQMTQRLGFHIGPLHIGSAIRALLGMLGFDPGFMATRVYSGFAYLRLIAALFSVICVVGVLYLSMYAVNVMRKDEKNENKVFLLFFFLLSVIPFVTALALNHAWNMILMSHYFLTSFIFLMFFVSIFLRSLPVKRLAISVFAVMVVIFSARLFFMYQNKGLDFKSAHSYVKEVAGPETLVIAPSKGFRYILDYYFSDIRQKKNVDDADLQAALTKEVIFVTHDGKLELQDKNAYLRSLLKEHKYTLKGSRSFGDLLIERYSL